jgi:hypothetical protein
MSLDQSSRGVCPSFIVFGRRKSEATRLGRLGVDVAGQVETVGRNGAYFKPGRRGLRGVYQLRPDQPFPAPTISR